MYINQFQVTKYLANLILVPAFQEHASPSQISSVDSTEVDLFDLINNNDKDSEGEEEDIIEGYQDTAENPDTAGNLDINDSESEDNGSLETNYCDNVNIPEELLKLQKDLLGDYQLPKEPPASYSKPCDLDESETWSLQHYLLGKNQMELSMHMKSIERSYKLHATLTFSLFIVFESLLQASQNSDQQKLICVQKVTWLTQGNTKILNTALMFLRLAIYVVHLALGILPKGVAMLRLPYFLSWTQSKHYSRMLRCCIVSDITISA